MNKIAGHMEQEEENKMQNPTMEMLDKIGSGIDIIREQYKKFQADAEKTRPLLPNMDQIDKWWSYSINLKDVPKT